MLGILKHRIITRNDWFAIDTELLILIDNLITWQPNQSLDVFDVSITWEVEDHNIASFWFVIGDDRFTSQGHSDVVCKLIDQYKITSTIARDIELDKHLILGKGERSTGKNRDSILSDSLEALIGSVYIDGGFEKVRAMIQKLFNEMILDINPDDLFKDSKSALQEALQENNIELPRYNLIKTHGEQHEQIFEVECIISSINLMTNGIGKNLKTAEQQGLPPKI